MLPSSSSFCSRQASKSGKQLLEQGVTTLTVKLADWKDDRLASQKKKKTKKKPWYRFTMEYYSVIKKWSNAICNNMGGPRDCHTEWSKLEEKYYMTSLICGL